MSRRPEPNRKKPLDVLNDLLDGHREAAIEGADNAIKYLERALAGNKSMPNATKFFLYDLLAEACAVANKPERCQEAVDLARKHIPDAQADAPRHWQDYVRSIRMFERGIALAVENGQTDQALELCQQALDLGLGKFYAAKADSIRRAAQL